MKFKLFQLASACLLLFLAAGPVPAGPVDPTTGLPLPGPAFGPIDPQTGLPVAQELISPDWVDPDITLTNVDYIGLPATEVVRNLREAFKNSFDIIITPAWTKPDGEVADPLTDPQSVVINLQMKNVTASELFRAMNLLLEAEKSPFRWHLLVNGKRPLVLFKVSPELLPNTGPAPAEKQLMVSYVGDLIGDGGMTMKEITDTLTDVNAKGFGGDIYIAFHEETQMVIVKGTGEQIALIHNALDALKQKMLYTLQHKVKNF